MIDEGIDISFMFPIDGDTILDLASFWNNLSWKTEIDIEVWISSTKFDNA